MRVTYMNLELENRGRQLEEKDSTISNLQSEFENHRRQLEEKDSTISNLQSEIENHGRYIEEQKMTIRNLTSERGISNSSSQKHYTQIPRKRGRNSSEETNPSQHRLHE
ncbi:hypothetical protein UPYG_G00246600 [Umbra pygmaea]|uniref:Uncharacterized protein n=1 Tax=Umbra pygmaea TaxID=75934 RepID=A0ABD0X6W1_UMBPY